MAGAVCVFLWTLLLAVNVFGFLTVRHDKQVAAGRRRERRRRVPERVLLIMAGLGAGAGQLLAFVAYRHKVQKALFLLPWALVTALGVLAWWGWLAALECLAPF